MRLSIVLLAYDMPRELPRTLRSMLPPLQKGVTGDDYEIVIVDNGSPGAPSLDGVDRCGVDVRLIRIPPGTAKASPVEALNEAAETHARGDALMICIDGARLFSPYIVRRTLDCLRRDARAFTYVGSRHLGRELQMKAVKAGYDQQAEDALLASVPWAEDLDRLNAISVWAGAHVFQSAFYQNESNAIGLRRDLWGRIGPYNSGFSRPGGGLCNLEIFRRYVMAPETRNILLLGEATFHQFHGGAATAKDGYFSDSLEEYKSVTGVDYAQPRFDFEVDVGAAYARGAVIDTWYYG